MGTEMDWSDKLERLLLKELIKKGEFRPVQQITKRLGLSLDDNPLVFSRLKHLKRYKLVRFAHYKVRRNPDGKIVYDITIEDLLNPPKGWIISRANYVCLTKRAINILKKYEGEYYETPKES